jgi:metal-dependent amidase/aminoacylase/carboxypeptidase family protein
MISEGRSSSLERLQRKVSCPLALGDPVTQYPAGNTNWEIGGGGKIKLLEAGAYKDYDVDINLISHPGIVTDSALVRTSAYTMFKVEYFGREAHAAASPWLGINALDAMVTAYNAISVLRQQTMPGDVIQGHISDGGVRPNVIHAYTAGTWVVRADTQARLAELKKKVVACFEAAAMATGATLQMSDIQSYADHVPNRVMGVSYRKYFNALSPPSLIPTNEDVDEIQGRTMASSDQGDISYAMPSLSPGFSIPAGPKGNGPHNPEFAETAGTKVAFERSLRVGKGLAGTAVDVLTTKGLLAEIKKEWKHEIKAKNVRVYKP